MPSVLLNNNRGDRAAAVTRVIEVFGQWVTSSVG
jgi:hypothetical protein